jgi:short-subunit dehydrogenase
MFAVLATGDIRMKKILIIGATSAIAIACAKVWAREKATMFLVGRDRSKLKQTADDLVVIGAASVHTHVLDLNHFDLHGKMVEESFNVLGEIDVVLIAHGTLPDQLDCQRDVSLAMHEFSINGLSVISVLTLLANRMEEQHSGTIAVISSVAGDRGRPSNYLYGSAKAAVTSFCEGLRARLFRAGVHVLTIKPGFVDTPMTKDLSLPEMLVVSPEKVAGCIMRGIDKRSDSIYAPAFWFWIMAVIRSIPVGVFKRMNL